MSQPNILFFYPDQLRHDWIGPSADFPIHTPNLDRLAAEGVNFTKALSPSPVCSPARACIATGMEYDRCRVPGNQWNLPLDMPNLYRLLRDEGGYHVTGCGKFDLHKPDYGWGVDGKGMLDEYGFSDGVDNEGKGDAIQGYRIDDKPRGPYMNYLFEKGLHEVHFEDFTTRDNLCARPTPLDDEDYCDNWIGRNGLELIDQAPADKPWFLQVNFNGPHPPWDITKTMEAVCRKRDDLPQPFAPGDGTPGEYLALRQNYLAMIENIDRNVGLYLALLEERGELDNTVIIFSSDHGEMLGDHSSFGKTQPLHPSARVPLIICGPGVRKAITCDAPTETLDITATCLDYAGVTGAMDSRSLRPFLEGGEPSRDYAISGLNNWRLVYDGQYKLIVDSQKGDRLFDLDANPNESNNLIDGEPETAARLAAILEREGVGHGYDGPEWSHENSHKKQFTIRRPARPTGMHFS